MDENINKENEILSETTENKNEKKSDIDKEEIKQEQESEENIDEVNIENLQKELEETKDKLLRSLAENENVRKQIEKIRLETNKYGVQPLAREILNVVDNFERAMSTNNKSEEGSLEEGLSLIQKEILSILEKFSVKKLEPLGQEFNANYHQAMFEKESNDYSDGQICEIIQDGYTFHERLLRPALVGVAKKKNNTDIDNAEKEKILNSDKENK
ncbi:MAG: nucleotide exchange factor GrpE [Rickettsiales bacterium]|nr:nucleotide exchange factor GrpE [Rickettsiales bacterium]OUV76182.1 MAG: nucleotide exchange factor GrpE [Rickettsiales bacterium TMED131]